MAELRNPHAGEVGSAGAKARASEARARERGGRRLPGGTLPPKSADALAKLQAAGYAESATACIARALLEAAGRPGKRPG